jgi:hypothetical protein
MDQYEIFRLLSPIATLLTMSSFTIACVRGRGRGSAYLQGFLLCAALVLAFSFLELSSAQPSLILLFSHFAYTAIAFMPVFWLLFACQYGLGRYADLRYPLAALSLIPTLTSIFAFCEPSFHLLWRSSSIVAVGKLRVNIIQSYGPWFWAHFVYSYLLFLAGAAIILKELFGHFDLYRRQALLLVSATGLPLFFNAAYVFRVVPGVTKDFSAIAFAFSGLLSLPYASSSTISSSCDRRLSSVSATISTTACSSSTSGAACSIATKPRLRSRGMKTTPAS